MHLASAKADGKTPSLNEPLDHAIDRAPGRNAPALALGLLALVVPAVGVPNELVLQDTLKSAVAAGGVLAAALLFFWQQRGRTATVTWHALVGLPMLLMFYALASMVWSHTYLAAVEAVRWFVLGLLVWLGINTLTRENLPMLVWGIHGGAALASLWAALQFWLDLGLFPQAAGPASTFINRNFFAEYAVCALPFSVLALANLRQRAWIGWVAATLALDLVAIMMTGSRSALIAMLALAPVFAVILRVWRRQFAFANWSSAHKAGVALILVVGVSGLGSIATGDPKLLRENRGTTALQRSYLRAVSMTDAGEYTEGSFSVRSVMWKATARMVMANPWGGVGAGAWEVQIPLYQPSDSSIETDYNAHNEFLQLLSEYGLVAGGLFLAVLFAYLLLLAGRTWRLQGADLREAPLRAIALASLLALLLVSNAGFPWHLAGTGVLFALSLAILAGSDARLGAREAFLTMPIRWRPGFSRAMLTLLACCALLAAYVSRQAMEAERKIVRAIQLARAAAVSGPTGATQSVDRKTLLLQDIREGIAINPHYRKLTPIVAELLATGGDWANAVWIWESVAASRPHIANLWASIVIAHTRLNQNDRAFDALKQLQRLQPGRPRVHGLEVLLLSRTGHEAQAAQMLTDYYNRGQYDYDLLQTGYALGLRTRNWSLAIRALELRNKTWPEQAADGYFRLGNIYADPKLGNEAKALEAFREGLQAVPQDQKENFRNQVPEKYRAGLERNLMR